MCRALLPCAAPSRTTPALLTSTSPGARSARRYEDNKKSVVVVVVMVVNHTSERDMHCCFLLVSSFCWCPLCHSNPFFAPPLSLSLSLTLAGAHNIKRREEQSLSGPWNPIPTCWWSSSLTMASPCRPRCASPPS